MKKTFTVIAAFAMTAITVYAQTFTLKSKDVGGQATQKQMADAFGCKGENLSPQLSWENAPEGTQSFAVTIYDKDAPTGSGFWHWVIFNIPVTVNELKTGAGDLMKGTFPKEAIQSMTDAGTVGYVGPCPPPGHGPHEYLVTVYALKTKLNLDKSASPAYVGFNLFGNTLAKASIVFYAQR